MTFLVLISLPFIKTSLVVHAAALAGKVVKKYKKGKRFSSFLGKKVFTL